jgi:hypothetical protein
MLSLFTALIGFIGTLVLAIVCLSAVIPRKSDRPAPIGWVLFIVALIGGYIGYRFGAG